MNFGGDALDVQSHAPGVQVITQLITRMATTSPEGDRVADAGQGGGPGLTAGQAIASGGAIRDPGSSSDSTTEVLITVTKL